MILRLFFFSFGFLALSSLPVLAQEADPAVQTIKTGPLHGVSAHWGFRVSLRQGETSGATVSVDSRLKPYLRTEVRDGILHLSFASLPPDLQRQNLTRHAEVTVRSLQRVEAHSGAHITGNGSFTADECLLEAHSGADIDRIDLSARRVKAEAHSGATLKACGKTESLEIATASGATADLLGLQASTVSARASSGSDLSCQPTRQLNAHASSGADIRYKKGTLNNSSIHTSSGGSVKPIQ